MAGIYSALSYVALLMVFSGFYLQMVGVVNSHKRLVEENKEVLTSTHCRHDRMERDHLLIKYTNTTTCQLFMYDLVDMKLSHHDKLRIY